MTGIYEELGIGDEALQGGADSVYFGVEKLNMRSHSANNFKMTDLKEIVRKQRLVLPDLP